jgi:hypothetical protein
VRQDGLADQLPRNITWQYHVAILREHVRVIRSRSVYHTVHEYGYLDMT